MSIWSLKMPAQDSPVRQATGELAPVTSINDDPAPDRRLGLKVSIHRALLDKINLAALDQLPRAQIEQEIRDIVRELLAERREAREPGAPCPRRDRWRPPLDAAARSPSTAEYIERGHDPRREGRAPVAAGFSSADRRRGPRRGSRPSNARAGRRGRGDRSSRAAAHRSARS